MREACSLRYVAFPFCSLFSGKEDFSGKDKYLAKCSRRSFESHAFCFFSRNDVERWSCSERAGEASFRCRASWVDGTRAVDQRLL